VAVSGTLRLASGGPAFDYVAFTDDRGYFTVDAPMPPGEYLWYIGSAQTLGNAGRATLVNGFNVVELGTLRTGDLNTDNCVNLLDFAGLRATFGKSVRDLGYDPRADFSGDHVADTIDFSLLRTNYGQCGSDPISTPTPTPTLPPDPGQVAPPLDVSVATDLGSASAFLYSGPNPIQIGVLSGTIHTLQVAVLRGKVLTRDGQPLPGVVIQILNHPELGQTRSRADGMFDMAVNGGGVLVVEYTKDGYLPVQRQVQAPWQDYASLPDVALSLVDPNVTVIDLRSSDPMQLAYGGVVSDTSGLRQSTLMFPLGTTAVMTLPSGLTQTLTILHVRSTEYTVGASGRAAMPADLPANSAYTYAAEFSIDEALLAGAQEVTFNHPILNYLENFLEFPVGSPVPAGYYDKSRGAWVAIDDGRVIQILGITGGRADLDIDGSGTPASPAALAALGITNPERQRLAELYTVGKSLWRVPITRFADPDYNWPWGCPDEDGDGLPDCEPPDQVPHPSQYEDCHTDQAGSIIGCENQTLGEEVDVTGTDFQLRYESDRVPGRREGLQIPLTGDRVRRLLDHVDLEIGVAGRLFHQSFAPTRNLRYTFYWDHRDAYGRIVQGEQPVRVRIGYVYRIIYTGIAGTFGRSFGGYSSGGGGVGASVDTLRLNATLWREWSGQIGGSIWDARPAGLGAWSLSVHHAYDPSGHILYLGDGTRRSAQAIGNFITPEAGDGHPGAGGDGGPATQAQLRHPTDVVVAADGNVYIADHQNHRVRRVGTDGVITTVAGNGQPGYFGDGGPATQARLYNPYAIAVGPDGSLFIADSVNNRIRRVGRDGIITTVAGTGIGGYSGDGGPATAARLNSPMGVAVWPDGSLLIADYQNHRVRRVGPDGTITTVVGTGLAGYNGDNMPAAQARLYNPIRVVTGPDGSFYIADLNNQRIRRVGPDGIISTVAGNGTSGFSGDGGPATEAQLNSPIGISLAGDGSLYIGDSANARVRRVEPDGTIWTAAGEGLAGDTGDGGLPAVARLDSPAGVDIAPDGNLHIADTDNSRAREVAPVTKGFYAGDILIPSEDGSEVYIFTGSGRHQRTLDALTGAICYLFAYDTAGRLIAITDGDGNVTAIERDGAGKPTAIVAPGGQRTTLALDPNGYLASIANPAGEAFGFTYTPDGLLSHLTDPRGNLHNFLFDSAGRLRRDEDPAGAVTTLSYSTGDELALSTNVYTVTVTTMLTRSTSYRVEHLPSGDSLRVTTEPSGARTEFLLRVDGSRIVTYTDGTIVSWTLGPDPRWGMLAPVVASGIEREPSGRTRITSSQRTAELANPNDPLTLQTLTAILTVNGQTFTSLYNAATRVLTDTSPTGRQIYTTLDTHGRVVVARVAGLDPINYGYDNQGRLVSSILGTGLNLRATTLSYTTANYLDTITNPIGSRISFGYSLAGQVLTQTMPLGRVIYYGYDTNGNVNSLTPPSRPGHAFTYTPIDLLEDYTPPDVGGVSNLTHYTYNSDRQLTQITRPDNATVSLGYDIAGRLSTLTFPQGTTTLGYDPATADLTTISAPGGITLAYGYDGDLLTDTTWGGLIPGTVHRTYNNDLRINSESVNGANSVSFGYDADGLLQQAGSLTLNRSGQNGLLLGTSQGGITDTIGYNNIGEVTTYTAAYNGTPLLATRYSFDKLGRITLLNETIDGTPHIYSYTYDLADRLSEVWQDGVSRAQYDYDLNGNRLAVIRASGTITGAYDNQDRLLTYSTKVYSYNANGELLSKMDKANNQTSSYSYDLLGNLRAVTLSNGSRIDYLIDGQDRRIGKKVNGIYRQGFLYRNGLQLIAELDSANNIVARFIYGSRTSVPDYMTKSGITYRIIADHLGSPRLVINAATGQVVQRMDYDEFGQVLTDTNPGFQPFGFAGGLYDRATGLVRFGARDYDAEVGRWLSKDPVLFTGGDPNLYQYVLNDPINETDPSGLSYLVYEEGADSEGYLYLYDKNGELIGCWRASNKAAKKIGYDKKRKKDKWQRDDKLKWPTGNFKFAYHKPHPESDANGKFGSNGNFVFSVDGRHGIGVHSGRANGNSWRTWTEGCIRTTDAATETILETYLSGDHIDRIEVSQDRSR
jgi:RHS repeat-associated protein